MADTSLFYKNDQLQKVAPRMLRLELKITAAKVASMIVPNSVSLIAFDAVASQAVIDTQLGTVNEFLLSAFDATAMGTDMLALIISLEGQCQRLTTVDARLSSGTDGATVVPVNVTATPVLTASTATSEAAKGAFGNVAVKLHMTGLDAVTSGRLVVELYYVAA